MTELAAIRLNKHLAFELGISRREADEYITAQRVRVNGQTAELGARINAECQIEVDGNVIGQSMQKQYIAFHKPVGYVCSRKAQGDAPTIYDLLPAELHALKPVGRLDKDSSGLLLLSNDGDFALQMTHPKFHKTKTYEVTLDKELEPLHQQMISDFGIDLEDGKSQLHLTKINDDSRLEWTISMHEGRNRQIRRTFAALGYTVTKLHRITFGTYSLHDLHQGAYKIIKK